jgi:protein TonB
MLETLFESGAIAQRRTGSSLASILIHGAIITGGVVATAKDALPVRIAEPVEHPVVYTVPAQPRVVQPVDPSPVADAPDVAAAPIPVRLRVPSIVPVGIPPVDLSVPPSVPDMGHGPVGSASVTCGGDCGATPSTDGQGRALWNDADLMMRLIQKPVPPRYPEALRRAGIEGDVVVRFVVDTSGRVDPRSIDVVRSTHDAFTAAVRESLAKLRFAPATVGAHKVSALAIMPFQFRLE